MLKRASLFLAFAVAGAALGVTMTEPYYQLPDPPKHIPDVPEVVVLESMRAGLPPHIGLNTAWRESKFDPLAVSRTGDRGVMQLSPRYFPPMSTEANIRAGVELLAKYYRASHDERLTWKAYNQGPHVLVQTGPRKRKR